MAAEKCFMDQHLQRAETTLPQRILVMTTYSGSLAFDTPKGTLLVSPLLGGTKMMLR